MSTATLDNYLPGNLILDASYFYQYDGWSRLCKVSARGTLVLDAGGDHVSGAPGAWIIHYTYDALGRLIRSQRPIASTADIYSEHYYYDGVRRIQEVHNNPVYPANDEEGSMEEETSSSTTNYTWVDRELIHTPGYVDEFVCETDRFDYPWYHIQDANLNVGGLVHETGVVVRQYTLDLYGRVIRSDQFAAHPAFQAAMAGLFGHGRQGSGGRHSHAEPWQCHPPARALDSARVHQTSIVRSNSRGEPVEMVRRAPCCSIAYAPGPTQYALTRVKRSRMAPENLLKSRCPWRESAQVPT